MHTKKKENVGLQACKREGKCLPKSLQKKKVGSDLQKSPVAGLQKIAQGPDRTGPKVLKKAKIWLFLASFWSFFVCILDVGNGAGGDGGWRKWEKKLKAGNREQGIGNREQKD